MQALKLGIPVGDGQVAGLLLRPEDAKALYVFAHGAGVGMLHPSMEAYARGLAERGIATLRYQFPYMEKGGGRPDPPKIAHATVRAAAAAAAKAANSCLRGVRGVSRACGSSNLPVPTINLFCKPILPRPHGFQLPTPNLRHAVPDRNAITP